MKEIQIEAKNVQLAVEKALKELALRRDQVEVVVLNEGSGGFLGIGSKKACVVVREKKWTGEQKSPKDYHAPKKSESRAFKPQKTQQRGNESAQRNSSHGSDRRGGYEKKRQNFAKDASYQRKPAEAAAPAAENAIRPAPQNAPQPSAAEPQKQMPVEINTAVETAKTTLFEILTLMGVKSSEIKGNWDPSQSRISVEFSAETPGIFTQTDSGTLDALQFIVTLIVSKKCKTQIAVQVDTCGYWKNIEDRVMQEVNKAVDIVKKTRKPYRFEPMPSSLRRFIHKALANQQEIETVSEGESRWRKIIIKPAGGR